MSTEGLAGHSADFFDEQRDYWWNEDFLRLMVQRLGLGSTRNLLDVGCGLGHWSRALTKVLPAVTEVVGIDPEGVWVQESRLVNADSDAISTATLQGSGERLPFPDESFDLVTCQTVLIHVADPVAVLKEMRRVARPDGTVFVAEPNNLAGQLVRTSVSAKSDLETLVSALSFYATCEAGKAALGEGDNSVGDLLPGYFAEAGLIVQSVYLSDKADPLWSPYASPSQAALVESLVTEVEERRAPWSEEQTRQYFLAGGGDASDFAAAWSARLNDLHRDVAAIRNGALSAGGGSIMYMVAGRKLS